MIKYRVWMKDSMMENPYQFLSPLIEEGVYNSRVHHQDYGWIEGWDFEVPEHIEQLFIWCCDEIGFVVGVQKRG